jgi:hypothetical protein
VHKGIINILCHKERKETIRGSNNKTVEIFWKKNRKEKIIIKMFYEKTSIFQGK